jgi:excisionase family DNA binding protein
MTTTDMPGRRLLRPEEVAEVLNIGRSMVYGLIKSGALRSVKIGHLRRVLTEDVDAYVAGLVDTDA